MRRLILLTTFILMAAAYFAIGQLLGPEDRGASVEAGNIEPAPAVADEARFERIAAVLEQSDTGRQLLTLKESHRVGVFFEAGYGSRFRQDLNLILMDDGYDAVKAALFFAHEMYHAQTFHEGTKADIKAETRETYVAKKLMEEAAGMAISVRIKMELEVANLSMAGVTLPLESQYRDAFQAAVERTRAGGTNLSEVELRAIGHQAGTQALYDAFASGEVKTSNTYEPYPEYYARDWEEAHPVKVSLANLFE
jgi:hypothetical protein